MHIFEIIVRMSSGLVALYPHCVACWLTPGSYSTDGYVSSVAVTDAGTIVYGAAGVTADGSSGAVGAISSATNPFLGTSTIAWMEVF